MEKDEEKSRRLKELQKGRIEEQKNTTTIINIDKQINLSGWRLKI